ncbi:hypothetical protein ACSMDF_17185 [Yersinia enterocolitica]|uniref:CdiI C-terminal domain-containing protein n=2 Tax=Yersinia TaxID=629 RepID=A0AAI8ZVD4_YERFR|nr:MULTISPECIES: hypothetical protein [Yersinia]ATM87409.1 hypothetical protein CRN74_15805 [Yersinia frederiksenii]AVX36788.1 hypothetical protein DA391_03375 [Yersinia massiliensis]MCB5317773.1 hypothetical protein [Yersinia massiliensis]MDN0128017.1 hypothetical protein [Yersinia massiliensis]CFR16771.1 Uncharacterised protein [Yersinia frederiksenii]
MFGIFPGDIPIKEYDEIVLPSSIMIDEFKESFNLPLAYWSVENYKASWRESIEFGLQNCNYAALAVSMYEPDYTNFVFTWVLYFEGKDIFVQNKILFLDECPGFMPDKINDYVQKRETHDEDGRKISEWSTDLKSVIDFYNSLK